MSGENNVQISYRDTGTVIALHGASQLRTAALVIGSVDPLFGSRAAELGPSRWVPKAKLCHDELPSKRLDLVSIVAVRLRKLRKAMRRVALQSHLTSTARP